MNTLTEAQGENDGLWLYKSFIFYGLVTVNG